MKNLLLLASAGFLMAGCVVVEDYNQTAGTPAPAPAAAPAPEAVDGETEVAETETPRATEERVCRRERVTGSNRPRRVCYTRRQYEEMQENARENLQRRGATCHDCAGN